MVFFVSGATGFVGRFLCERLLKDGLEVRGTLLESEKPPSGMEGVELVVIKSLESCKSMGDALTGVDVIIHLAARVHIMHETAADPLHEFRKVNLYGTEHLVRQAAQAGVKRFVFMSTIGVNGDNSEGIAYTEQTVPHPHNFYSMSKFEAEQAIVKISEETGIEVVIIRAPLVYGPRNPGNFLSLLRVISKGIPLPMASVKNKRSLIYVGNLVDALAICAVHPVAVGKTYLVSDGEDVSTSELICKIAFALGVSSLLFNFPISLMRLAAKMTGKSAVLNSLLSSLVVDNSKIRQELLWKPPYTMAQGLRATADWFQGHS